MFVPPTRMPPRFLRPNDPEHPSTSPLISSPVVYEPLPPTRWEYRVVTVDLREDAPLDDERLSTLGAEGWILACVVTLPSGSDPARRLLYHFVRAL